MKIKFQCNKCFIDHIDTYDFVQVSDESLYTYVCSKGHENLYFLKNEKFELLIETAMYAINDGYFREAVSSFSSSLESLYLFIIEVIFKKYNSSSTIYEETFKNVSQQSERQLGAFIMLYVKEFGVQPQLLTEKERNFRNKVIHKGKFPTYDETINYGQRTLDIIYHNLLMVRNKLEYIIQKISSEKQELMLEKFEALNVSPFTHLSKNSINIHHHVASFNRINIEEYLKTLKP